MANKVEFQLTSDAAQAMADANKLVDKMAALTESYKQANAAAREQKEAGKAFDEVAGAVGKVAAALGLAGGVSAIFNNALQTMEERAAAINREAEKSLAVARQGNEGAGRMLQNLPGMTDAELREAQKGIRDILLANPSQGAGAQGIMFDALTGVRSAVPTLNNAQALAVVNEAAQTRQLDTRLPLADIAQGFGALMASTGLDANAVQNAAMFSQNQGFVADLGQVLKNTAVIQPAAKAAGVSPTDAFAMFNFGTKVLQDTQGERTATAVSTILSNMSLKAGEIEEATGFRPTGNAIERLEQVVNLVRGGGVDEDQLGKLMPKLAEGVAGRTLMQSLFQDGFGKLQMERDVFGAVDLSQGDLTGTQIDRARRLVPGFNEDFQLRSQTALREAGLAGDKGGQRSAAVRAALRAELEAEGMPDRALGDAEASFDAYIGAGFSPASALDRARSAARMSNVPVIGGMLETRASRGVNVALDVLDAGAARTERGERTLFGRAEGQDAEALLDGFVERMAAAVETGMTRANQNTRQRQPVTELDR